MAVALSSLVDSLKRAIDVPGGDTYPTVTNGQWVGYLGDAFWLAKIEAGLFSDYAINGSEEIVNTEDSTIDLPRDLQQVIVVYAALIVVTNAMKSANSTFRVKAGPAEFETSQGVNVQRDILAALLAQKNAILEYLSDLDSSTAYIFDMLCERLYSPSIWVR